MCVVMCLVAGGCGVDGGEEEGVAGAGREAEEGDRTPRQ